MQHERPKQFHRSTIWRRQRAEETQTKQPARPGRRNAKGKPPGRQRWTRSTDTGLIGYAASAVTAMNELERVDFSEVFPLMKIGPRLYRKPAYRTLAKLWRSPYPAGMIAVATSELLPLNFLTRRHPTIRPSFHELPDRKAKFERALELAGYEKTMRDIYLAEAAQSDYQDDWVKKICSEFDTDPEKRHKGEPSSYVPLRSDRAAAEDADEGGLEGEDENIQTRGRTSNHRANSDIEALTDEDAEPEASLTLEGPTNTQKEPPRRLGRPKKGTPAHQIPYIGASLSARIACYWRQHRDFRACKVFVANLITPPLPKGPYLERVASVDHELTAAFHASIRKQRQKRTAT